MRMQVRSKAAPPLFGDSAKSSTAPTCPQNCIWALYGAQIEVCHRVVRLHVLALHLMLLRRRLNRAVCVPVSTGGVAACERPCTAVAREGGGTGVPRLPQPAAHAGQGDGCR